MTDPPDSAERTWQTVLAKWDAGETVFTVEMGGLGPGYDHAINVLVFDLLRHFKTHGCRPRFGRKFSEHWYKAVVYGKGYSGAQVGVAFSLACHYVLDGYEKVLHDPKLKDRLIQDEKEPFR